MSDRMYEANTLNSDDDLSLRLTGKNPRKIHI